jgi:tetrahydromethanopterin S-methyltransferase subunit G
MYIEKSVMITAGGNPMASDTLDVRMARLEGAYEQITQRLGTIETRLDSLEVRMETRFAGVEARFNGIDAKFNGIDAKFNWVIGILVTSWITVMLAILLRT